MELMGFNSELSKKALIKVNNESLTVALDALMELQAAQPKKIEPEIIQIVAYECQTCTLLNPDGKAVCEACGAEAPQTAYVVIKNEVDIQKQKEEEELKKKQEEEAFIKAAEEEIIRMEAELKKQIAEEEALKKKEQRRRQIKSYYEKSRVIDFLFASVNNGIDAKPLLTAAVLQNSERKTIDIEFLRFGYHQSYLREFVGLQSKPSCQVCDIPFKSIDLCLYHVFDSHRTLVEGLYPAFIGSQKLNKNWILRTNRQQFLTLKHDHIATLVLPFEHLDSLCQIGQDISALKPIYIIAIGKKQGSSTQSTIIQKIEINNDTNEIRLSTVSEDSLLFKSDEISSDVSSLNYCQRSHRLLVENKQKNTITLFEIDVEGDNIKLAKVQRIDLDTKNNIIKLENGILFVNDDKQCLRRFIIDPQIKQNLKIKKERYQLLTHQSNKEAVSEEDILKMNIDPANITIYDIKRYEKLMNGKSIRAVSNAQTVMNDDPQKGGKVSFNRHHWDIQQFNEQQSLEMEFDHPTSLISLNIEMTFNCNNVKLLSEKLQSHEPSSKQNKQERTNQIDTSSKNNKDDINEHDNLLTLGLLNIHGQSESGHHQQQQQTVDQQQSKNLNYLPLVVDHYKGASYNQTYQVSRIVTDNNLIFASNYPKPEFYLKHQHGHKMTIDKFTVRSNVTSKCGAYPVGSGIIFTADYMAAFELSTPFHKFTLTDYNEWRQERLKDPSPLKPYEPVAYFEFETDTSITVEVDYQRTCKYIMLKPTGFRKKPTQFTQNINNVPMEIEFFGVMGTSIEENSSTNQNDNDSGIIQDLTLNNIHSHYELDVRVLNDTKILKQLHNIEIHSLIGDKLQMSGKVIQAHIDELGNISIVGKTCLKITDSHLQLQNIQGLSLTFKNNSFASEIWELRGVSVQAIVAEQDDSLQSQSKQTAIFNETRIPLSYMRSCLLSPKFFNVVNKILAQQVQSQSHSYQLRLTIIQFLNKIIKLDRDFIPYVLEQVQLEEFLKVNLLSGESSGSSVVVEFLQNFQRDVQFCYNLYQILLTHIQHLPNEFISYNGYEALIGLIKWAIPINAEKTLETLFQTLYKDICLNKIEKIQSKEYISFRTIHQFQSFYPFDMISFKAPKNTYKQVGAESQGLSSDLQNRALLPVNQIKKSKHNSHNIYEVDFNEEMTVSDVKIYFANIDQIQYKMIIKIYGEDNKIIYFNTFDEQIFSQFASMIYQKNVEGTSQDDALHLTGLSFRGKFLKIVLEFGISNSSLPRTGVKNVPPQTLIEVYGQTHDIEINPQRIKELIDNKAKEYWTLGGKLFRVGKSVQMLQITHDSQTQTLVPQGTVMQGQALIQKTDFVSNEQLQVQAQVQAEASVSQKHQELELLQEELKGKIRSNDSNIKEILEKIQSIQISLSSTEQSKNQIISVVQSLEYYSTLTSDLTKLIRSLIKTQKLNKDKILSIIRKIQPDGDMSTVCFELFKRFVVYDSGSVKQDILSFIAEFMQPIMKLEEKRTFTFRVIEEFLSTPQQTFSQNAVIESLNSLGIPEGELISFLIQKLNITGASETKDMKEIQPFVFMSSVLILALNQLKQIDIPEPGQVIHKGVSCNSCRSKIIVGWRYKCGHCPEDVNFDEKCVHKHLEEHPSHVMIIIQKPLPYNTNQMSKAFKNKKPKSIFPTFEFKETQEDIPVHEGMNCENCGKKPIIGTCYKCANCEDYNLCENCYTQNSFDHFSFHVFMKLHKALKEVEKNPTTMLQVLDPRLYPIQQVSSQLETIQSPTKKKTLLEEEDKTEDEDDFEDLTPLSIARSLSTPMPALGKQKNEIRQQQSIISSDKYEKLDTDQQFVVLFHACVWICQDQSKFFSKIEKTVLLKLTIETMLQLIKLTSVKHIQQVIQNKEAFFQVLLSILQINSKDLISLFKTLFDNMRQPPSLLRKIKEEQAKKEKNPTKPGEKVVQPSQDLIQELQTIREILEQMIQHIQNFLKWLIDLGIQPDLAKLQAQQDQESWGLLLQNYTNQKIWLDHLSFILELFIKTTDELKESKKSYQSLVQSSSSLKDGALEKIPEEKQENDDEMEDLIPLSVARSISVPINNKQIKIVQQSQSASLSIIKSLVQLLYINDQSVVQIPQISPVKGSIKQVKQSVSHFRETESQTKYLSQLWSLVLKSLTTVGINQLIEAKIFDSLVNAFLISTEEIKQITFPQILGITESIARQSVHVNDISKFISNLLFTTLENVTDNHHEKVGYSICQGWLDILITSSIARVATYEQNKTVYAQMSADEISIFLKKSALYLNQYLNKGSFEGTTGSNMEIMMRLNIATDLFYVIRYAENKKLPGTLAISELFNQVSNNAKIRKDYQDSLNHLLCWLFLNARQAKEDILTSQLGNSSALNPATAKVKQITEMIEEIFQILGDNGEQNEEAVKIALSSLTQIVKKMNKTILDLSHTNSLGFELTVKYSDRTNEYFTKLLGQWLVSDKVASYFVFDLSGFEFLLDTIGVGSEDENNISDSGFEIVDKTEDEPSKTTNQMQQNTKKQQLDNQFESLQGSDLGPFLEQYLRESQQNLSQKQFSEQKQEENLVPSLYDKTTPIHVQEFSKSIAMISNNGADPPANYLKTDWSVNKRAYKHRILVKHLTGNLRSEYWMMFSFPHPVELREIQIGFNNFWGTDTEIYAEPLSVLVEAGMDENNLSLVCNLQIVKDDAFGSVSATVFGQNLQTFQVSQNEFNFSHVEDIITQKLQSIQNYKVQYIKFCMRRHIITCLENSPLATKFSKQVAFGINYISLLGHDLTKIGEYITYVKQEQKKTALEVLSLICSGDFANILQVIANQPQTIEKMKKSFNLLASLVSIKQNLIEPTFIAISTYNTEMGDWIINEFLKSGKIYKHASLVGEIIMCNKQELPRRLNFLKDHVMSQLALIVSEERSTHTGSIKKLYPFVQIFIQTLRIAAPDLEQSSSNQLIDLEIKESYLTDIVSLLSAATQEREVQTKILTQLLVLILCPPEPFTNKNVDAYEFTVKYLIDDQGLIETSNETQFQKERLASILAATKTQIAQEIYKKGIKIEKLFNPGQGLQIENENEQNLSLQHCIKFWINISSDNQVKYQLAKDKMPLKIYEILRQENPESNNRIIRKDSVIGEQELNLLIELIKSLTAGIPELEAELAALLMQDLDFLSRIRDMNFVNKVFLPLLRIEKTVPVCLWPYDSDNKKWIPSYKPQAIQDSSSTQGQGMSYNNFVPSQILTGEKRSIFIKNLKEIVGQQSKGQVKKLLSSNWTLAHSQTEMGISSQFQNFWKNIENKGPVVVLISCTSPSGSNVVYGCYCTKGIPAMPSNLAQDSDYPVNSNPEDFVFCYIDDNSYHHFVPKASVPIVSMFTDYEGGGAISIANDFMLMSFSYDFVFTVGIQYDLEKIQTENNPKPEKEVENNSMNFVKFEIWSLDQTKTTHQTGASEAQNKVQQKQGLQLGDTQLEQSLSHEVKHPWFNSLMPFVNYRTNPVFMVPAQLSLSQLSKILLDSNVFFKTRVNSHHISQSSETLQDLYQQMSENTKSYESLNGIIDLEYEVNQLLNNEPKAQEELKEGEDQAAQEQSNGQAQLSGYVPLMGLFQSFEDKGGVRLIIQVTLQSMKLWKSEEQAKSWELWLKELESFSEIPLFFQFFLKNNRCKDLLFKVLAGLPDQEISAEKASADIKTKWEEEQKMAVQFNYKILSEAFQTSNDLKLRETAMKCGLLPRILERLSAISGEKPRTIEEETKEEEIKEEIKQIEQMQQQTSAEKNVEKKKRKGVGYSSKVGQTFNVTQYLENKKLRNDQIKNLVDICSNFLNSKEWQAGDDVLDIVLESALLPILESAFRNGSWLDMAKENEVYHSYLEEENEKEEQKEIFQMPKILQNQQNQFVLQKSLNFAKTNIQPSNYDAGTLNNFLNMIKSSYQNKLDSPKSSQDSLNKGESGIFGKGLFQNDSALMFNNLIPKDQLFSFPPNPFDFNVMEETKLQSQINLESNTLKEMIEKKQDPITLSGAMKNLIEQKSFDFPDPSIAILKPPLQFNQKYKFKTVPNDQYNESQSDSGDDSVPDFNDYILDKFHKAMKSSSDSSQNGKSPTPKQKSNSYNSSSSQVDPPESHEILEHDLIENSPDYKDLDMEKALMKYLQNQNQQLQEKKVLMIEEEELIQKLEKQNKELNTLYKQLDHMEGKESEEESQKSQSYDSYGDSNNISQEEDSEHDSSLKSENSSHNSKYYQQSGTPSDKKSSSQEEEKSSDYETLEEESLDSHSEKHKEESNITKKMQSLDNKLKSISSKFIQIKKKNATLMKHKMKLKTIKPKLKIKVNKSDSQSEAKSPADEESNLKGFIVSSSENESFAKDSFEIMKFKNKPKPQNLISNLGKAKPKSKNYQIEESESSNDSDQNSYPDSSSNNYDSESDSSDSNESDSDAPNLVNGDDFSESQSYNSEDDSIDSHSSNSVKKDKEEEYQEMHSEIPENLARDVIKTFKLVQSSISRVLKNKKDENYIENALNLPVPQSYRILLQDLRFDYMDIKDPNDNSGTNYKHHYNSIAQQNQNPPSSKMVRLAQELADLSNALPSDHTNAIFVRVDQQRVDLMKALVCGAANTPYAHGCYEYDIFCDNNYPREPPKMNLITTGSGSVRFNPNLYACGKVCLSLLGTWRGSATENWDPKLSTILQVLLSTQAIIMSEEVYFNEPGFENEAGTPEGEKKNEGYQNIVRYCNIKFAMIDQIKKPSKGFETVIKRHFYIKKAEVLKEVHHWVELAEKNEATYSGLVNDHNYNWANQFKQSKTKYKEMIVAAVQQLEEELNKLERPTDYELKLQEDMNKKRQQQQQKKKKRQAITEGKADLGEIDMDTDEEEQETGSTMIDTTTNKIDVEDEAVKDRWSRYIGAMGIEAVTKQAAANIFLSGAGALGIEIAKNLVLSGCKSFTMHDFKPITMRDLSGQFFLNLEEDVLNEKKKKNTRGQACMPRLKQLNYYVKCNLAPPVPIPLSVAQLESPEWNFKLYDVIILTEANNEEIVFVNEYCRKNGKKLIVADAYGVFTRVFTDFGDKFEILDKNGEDLQDVMIKSISSAEQGIVELLPNTKHKFEDGDEVLLTGIEGMKLLPGKEHEDKAFKSDSINETIHKVKVITPYSFYIGDTTVFEKYERNGLAKQLKTKVVQEFKDYKDCMLKTSNDLVLDSNLAIADFEKMQNNNLAHIAFEALDTFKRKHMQTLPAAWNKADAQKFMKYAREIALRYDMNPEEWKPDAYELKFLYLFCFTCQGVFNPLCAFQGGVVAQECMKAITQKFSPIKQVFYYDAIEVLPDFDVQKDLEDEDKWVDDKWVKDVIKTMEIGHRSDGLRILLGADLVDKLAHTRLFMVGAGAIGCELLKNYAMLGVGTGKEDKNKKLQAGSIVLTDPDVIEVSNLNRQFLFREKHLRKPKSSTAAAAAIYMNKELKENIIARLDKVHEGTAHIFSDQFFEGLNVVTNALDNLHARKYIDIRCVTAKTPLLESGTLGPKGHIQVILPYKTESYGSQTDPEDNTEIPHCTLKMFPEETLHCVEWARDIFGKMFTQAPQNVLKVIEEGDKFNPQSQQDTQMLKQAVKLLEKRPSSFQDCIVYARHKFEKFFNHDIKQLLHVYPLDSKTKDGNLFWSLPKRPPVPQQLDPSLPLHQLLITSMACLRAVIFNVEIPHKNPRTEEFRREVAKKASEIEVEEFVANDEKAKEIQASVQKEGKEDKEEDKKQEEEEHNKIDPNDVEMLTKKFKSLLDKLPQEEGTVKAEKVIHPENFEKDNDANHHIDLIYSLSNCRSQNYKLDLMDWLTVKLKAGRIVPALSTTTSAVAGLQTLELVKLVKGCKKEDHRNVFLNIAVPIMQASEPADVLKTKLTKDLEVTLWDRWEVKLGKDVTLAQIISYLQVRNPSLLVRDVLRGNAPLYFHAIMNAPGKEQEKHKTLETKLAELIGIDVSEDKYLDIAVTMVNQEDKEEQIISGVPPVRVYFQE